MSVSGQFINNQVTLLLLPLLFGGTFGLNRFGNRTYTVGIWSGKETVSTRALDQAKTWFKFWDEVIIFSDKFYSGACERVSKEAYPCRIQCISLGDFAHHLDGTEYTARWYFAQPRFLPAMQKAYELNPDSDFFIFGDDDTYLGKPVLLRRFGSEDPNLPKGTGIRYCSWAKVAQDIEPKRTCHPFLQGGGGVILSNALMKTAAPHLLECNKRFNDAEFAGSMRFAVCMERLVGIHKWQDGAYIDSWMQALHSEVPKVELRDRRIHDPCASFHRMNHSDYVSLDKTVYAKWKWKGRKYKADLGLFAYVEHSVPMLKNSIRAVWRVGVSLVMPVTQKVEKPVRAWKPILDENGTPIGYEQKYSGGIIMRLINDEAIPPGDIRPYNIMGKNKIFEYAIYPPEVRCIR